MIGGLVRCSFVDFPGCLSAVVFLRGCNLRCPYCHNAGLLDPAGPVAIDTDALCAFLASRRGRLDGVVVSGGEPTLQPDLAGLLTRIRALGFRVKLDTNGTRPAVLEVLLSGGLLDYVALDLKDEPAGYQEWLGMPDTTDSLLRSLDVVKQSAIDHELRTTVVAGRHDDDRLDRMAGWAAGCRRWILQPCRVDGTGGGGGAGALMALDAQAARLRTNHGINCHTRSAWGRQDRTRQD